MAVALPGTKTPEAIRDLWRTPEHAFLPLDNEFNFGLDAAASHANTLVKTAYFTEEMDGLKCDWGRAMCPLSNRAVWCNPPYSDIEPWMVKAERQCKLNNLIVVLLVPHTPDAGWWPDNASEIRVVTGVRSATGRNTSGRIQFLRADTGKPAGNQSKGSCYVIFAPGTLGNMTTKYIKITELLSATESIKALNKAQGGENG